MVLLDTDILIELAKKNRKIVSHIKKIGETNICISKISVLEMYIGAFDKNELRKIKLFLNDFSQLSVGNSIIDRTIDLIDKYCLSHTLYINDAIIAATAIKYNTPLYTLNIKDFKFIKGLELWNYSMSD